MINVKNKEKLEKAIEAVQERAQVRKIRYQDIIGSVKTIEQHFGGLLTKKDQVGLRIAVDPNGQAFPSAYKWIPESTRFILVRRPSGWFVERVSRGECGALQYRFLNLSDEQKIKIANGVISQWQ